MLVVCPFLSLYLYRIPRMFRQVNLVPRHWSSILYVCSSAMFVDPEGRGSMQGTRVSLINVGMGPVNRRLCS
jgi:hypothetical protein